MAVEKNPPVVIPTEWGNVTEKARLQAAKNIARDPVLKARMISQFGEGLVRRQYPEAFETEEEPNDK
jgi:hypothetical protein